MIQYLVKADSTRYTDLYVRWSKDEHAGLFRCGDVLLMRRFFIPEFTGENANHIFLKHGCSTSDEAMLVLSKDSLVGREVWVMFDYDLVLGQIAYVPERSFSLDTLEVSVVDFTRGQERSVIFKNHCNLAPEYGCIDSIAFKEKTVELYATLLNEEGRVIKEKQTVHFDSNSK